MMVNIDGKPANKVWFIWFMTTFFPHSFLICQFVQEYLKETVFLFYDVLWRTLHIAYTESFVYIKFKWEYHHHHHAQYCFCYCFFFSFIYDTKNEWRSVKSKKKNKKIKMWIQNHWLWLWNKQTNEKKVNAVLNVSNHVCMCQQKKNHKAGPNRMPYTNIYAICFTLFRIL